MLYTLDEIVFNTNSYFFYKNHNLDNNKLYKVSMYLDEQDESSVFLPFTRRINNVQYETFSKIENAVLKGARAFFFDEDEYYKEPSHLRQILFSIIEKYNNKIDFILMTKNTIDALEELAYWTRTAKLSKDVKFFAITGVVGKTSTTSMVSSIAKTKFNTYTGSMPMQNLRFQILHRFLEVTPEAEVMVFECSGAVKGNLRLLSNIIMPDFAIITKVAEENIDTYGSLENIAKEKMTLLSSMNENQIAIINDCPYLKAYSNQYEAKQIFVKENDYTVIDMNTNGSKFKYKENEYELALAGAHQISNAVKVIELMKRAGFSSEQIKQGLRNVKQIGTRWTVRKFENNVEFIIDCPNLTYPSLMSSIDTFAELYKNSPQRRLVISRIETLGDKEEEIYINIAKKITESNIDEIITIGKEIRLIYEYVKNNSKKKAVYFEKPKVLDKNDPFIKYLLDTMNYPQTLFIRTKEYDGDIYYYNIKDILEKNLVLSTKQN